MDNNNLTSILLESGTNEVEFLEFCIGQQSFAVNVSKVSQSLVFKNLKLTKTPCSIPSIMGTIYFRDHPINIIDLGSLLSLSSYSPNKETQLVLVMEFNQRITGFVIDSVQGIVRVTWKDFIPLDPTLCNGDDSTVAGTVTIDGRIIMILDMEQLLKRVDPLSVREREPEKSLIAPKDTRGSINIIYAEDSPLIRKLTTDKLKEVGFQSVLSFTNGALALEHVLATEGKGIDIILSDIEMPQLDGLSFCKRVKSVDNLKSIPFIFYSSMINEQMNAKCLSVGGNAAFSKPELSQLISSLEDLATGSKTIR